MKSIKTYTHFFFLTFAINSLFSMQLISEKALSDIKELVADFAYNLQKEPVNEAQEQVIEASRFRTHQANLIGRLTTDLNTSLNLRRTLEGDVVKHEGGKHYRKTLRTKFGKALREATTWEPLDLKDAAIFEKYFPGHDPYTLYIPQTFGSVHDPLQKHVVFDAQKRQEYSTCACYAQQNSYESIRNLNSMRWLHHLGHVCIKSYGTAADTIILWIENHGACRRK